MGIFDRFRSLMNRMEQNEQPAPEKTDITVSDSEAAHNIPEITIDVHAEPGKNAAVICEKLKRIMELSKELHACNRWWYYDADAPLARQEILNWCKENGHLLPEAYIACLTVAGRFVVDYCSTTGYFRVERFHLDWPLDQYFTADHKRQFEKKIPFKECIGWLDHHCIYYDVFTRELFLEQQRYQYTPIRDFAAEILDPVIAYLEEQLTKQSVYRQLLEESKSNPLRPMYDQLLRFAGNGDVPAMGIQLEPPVSEEEIVRWEQENGMQLPAEYRNWIRISNGSEFHYRFILSLERLRGAYRLEPIDGTEYVILAGISGCCDYLVFNSQTGEYKVLTEDHDLRDAEGFAEEVFLDAFESMEEEMECE